MTAEAKLREALEGRKCEICGGRNGAITCYRTALHKMGIAKSYAHMKCFVRALASRAAGEGKS